MLYHKYANKRIRIFKTKLKVNLKAKNKLKISR